VAYRDDREALQARVQRLERELTAERERGAERDTVATEVRALRRKLASATKEILSFDREALRRREQRTRVVAGFVLGVAITVACVAAVVAIESRQRAHEMETELVRSHRRVRDRAPALAPTPIQPPRRRVGGHVGDLAPDITSRALDGMRIDLRGGVTVVHLFASWAEPSMRQTSILDRVQHRLRARGLLVVGLSNDSSLARLEAAVAASGIAYPVVHDATRDITAAFQPHAFPTTYVIGRDGVIRYVLDGFRDADAAALERQIFAAVDDPSAEP
jgi:peroxiredoxin